MNIWRSNESMTHLFPGRTLPTCYMLFSVKLRILIARLWLDVFTNNIELNLVSKSRSVDADNHREGFNEWAHGVDEGWFRKDT